MMAAAADFETSVFINCPFDENYAPLLEAALFCIVYFGLSPRLANERLEAGENRLEKIVEMIRGCKFSIHDLSRSQAENPGEYFRMNMPFELGIDFGFRRTDDENLQRKKFLIFEKNRFDLKRSLSDIAGLDVDHHKDSFEEVIKCVRDFFRVEADIEAPGAAKIEADYATFQGWMTELKIFEGHSERSAISLPTRERLETMKIWNDRGRPTVFSPEHK